MEIPIQVNLSLDKLNVETTCVSIVREYLARKNFKETLKTLDEECPRDERSLNSRTKILDYLKINELYETNKRLNKPYAAVLELIMSYLVENDLFSNDRKKQQPPQVPTRSAVSMGDKPSKLQSTSHDIKVDDTEEGELADGSEKRFNKNSTNSNTNIKSSNIYVNKEPVKIERISKVKPKEVLAPQISYSAHFEENIKLDNFVITDRKIDEFNASDQTQYSKIEAEPKKNEKSKVEEEDAFDMLLKMKAKQIQEKTQPAVVSPRNDILKIEETSKSNPAPVLTPILNNNPQILAKDYILTPIDYQTATALKQLVFGNANTVLNEEWKAQAFTFCDYPKLKYGFVQKKGGPCGVLASLQAYFILELLFMDDSNCNPVSFNINKRDRSKLLARAIAKLLWKCGNAKNHAILCIPTAKAHFAPVGKYRSDGITETLNLLKFDKYETLLDYLMKCVSIYETDDNPGCVLLLYSAILSREIKTVQSDMDVQSNTLMGQHFYCTQEMVNLLIHGKAYSNVFNDTINCDQLILRGPDKRNDIGLLSLFEHYKSCEVGSYYKTPKYPVWVICSESHFSVLFSLKKEILSDWKAEKKFDLYYYDGLAKQDEQIRLTIDSTKNLFSNDPYDIDNRTDDLIPPLELVIRTKWNDTRIDWNGYDPIL